VRRVARDMPWSRIARLSQLLLEDTQCSRDVRQLQRVSGDTPWSCRARLRHPLPGARFPGHAALPERAPSTACRARTRSKHIPVCSHTVSRGVTVRSGTSGRCALSAIMDETVPGNVTGRRMPSYRAHVANLTTLRSRRASLEVRRVTVRADTSGSCALSAIVDVTVPANVSSQRASLEASCMTVPGSVSSQRASLEAGRVTVAGRGAVVVLGHVRSG